MPLRDLTHPLESGMPVYPGGDPAVVEPGYTYENGGVRTTEFSLDSHNGTHIDAPSHMSRDGRNLADFYIGEFRFDTFLVDCTDLGDREPIPADRVPNPAGDDPQESGDNDLLVFRTDWSEHWGTDRYFDHPYLSETAAEVAANNGFDVAMDVMSPDPTPSPNADTGDIESHPAHDALFAQECRIIENLTNLAGLPREFILHAYPLPLGRDGAQIRAVAEF